MIVFMIRAIWLTLRDPENGFAEGRRFLTEATLKVEPIIHDAALSESYQQCIDLMANTAGTWTARLWRWWRWMRPLLPPPPTPPKPPQ
jgi:hypothetical protein